MTAYELKASLCPDPSRLESGALGWVPEQKGYSVGLASAPARRENTSLGQLYVRGLLSLRSIVFY